MCKKQSFVFLILVLTLILISGACNESTRTTTSAAKATPLPDEMIQPGAGLVWLVPTDITANKGQDVAVEVHANTGSQKFAAYGFLLAFDPKVIDVNVQKGTNSVDALADGYVQAVNANKKGEIFIAGFDVYGKGPGKDLAIIRVNLKAMGAGVSDLTLTVKSLIDEKSTPLGRPAAQNAKVTVK